MMILNAYSCQNDIKNRVTRLQSEIDLAEKALLEELDKNFSEVAETLRESDGLHLREIKFMARELSTTPASNILGYLSVDGLLPSHLSLSLSSELTDLKLGSSVIMAVEPDTEREGRAGLASLGLS